MSTAPSPQKTAADALAHIEQHGREILAQLRHANDKLAQIAESTKRAERHLFLLALPIYLGIIAFVVLALLFVVYRR